MGNFFRIVVLTALLMPSQAWADCAKLKKRPTVLNIQLELPEPYYDLKQDIKDINKAHTADEWIARNGMEKVWQSKDMVLLGYAEGAAGLAAMSKLDAKKYDIYGVYYCPFITHLDLSMILRTRIVIPKNFKRNGCRFNQVLEHELRHYQANRDVAEKFVKTLHHDLPVIIKTIENEQPYVDGLHAPQKIENMRTALKDAVQVYIMEGMRDELRRRNDLIDTPEEYASSGDKLAACKD